MRTFIAPVLSLPVLSLLVLSFSAVNGYAQTLSPSGPAVTQPGKADSPLSVLPLLAPQMVAVDGGESVALLKNFWQGFSDTYITNDADGVALVDYARLNASEIDTAQLDAYIQGLSTQTPSQMPRKAAMAYWANLYNALTVQVVAQNHPVKSIREIKSGRRKGPWKRELIVVEGRALSLDAIEHDILRPTFKTPLVHYMLNCASIGCPNLSLGGWQAQTLEADLDKAARTYINSARGVSFDGKHVTVSRIYKWFRKDFGGSKADVLAHLTQYADPDLRKKLEAHGKIDKYAYDWALNAP